MMKIFISDAVVSRGYDGAPAIRLFNSENGEGRSAPVIGLDDIKFSHTGGQKKEQNGNGQDTGGQGQQGYSQAPGASQAAPAAPVQSGQTMQALSLIHI